VRQAKERQAGGLLSRLRAAWRGSERAAIDLGFGASFLDGVELMQDLAALG
jgi:hypothetical protein